ncbi:MAG: hypothetical protein UY87_C0004G0018 [Candidatus Peribacteria bacterium GW2011_GWC2_54_8]|nr:MAG: hypothetical protein UY87_C0004G0018 [Candidatus Peribacteria bacterium GW2011_GWC2_54_8]
MQKVFAQGGAASPAETEQKFLPDIDPEATERVVHAMRGLLMTALVQPTLSEGSAAMRDLAGAFSRSDLQQRKILILGACSPSDEH